MTFDSHVQARVRVPAAVQHDDPGDVRRPAARRGVVADPGSGNPPPPALAQPTSVITAAAVFSDSDIFFFAFNIQRAFHLSLLL